MSGLQNFLAPFSHLLFLNRNLDIVVLCFVLFGVAMLALVNHWRADRLERDLTSARSNASVSPAGRRYSAAPMVAEPAPAESGGPLPPVKGGRTYARNLGSALQKAGMSQPIYSPPTPAGWAPQSSPGQPGAGQPGMAAPYGTPNVPWAATQPAPPAAPWAFPGGSGRNMPGPSPSAAPFYQPQQPMPQPPSAPAPNVYSPPPGSGGFPPPPPMTGPFAPPAFSTTPTSGPAAPAPSFSPQVPNPMMPPVPQMPAPTPEPAGSDAARRGKPKRRRFNFNVLENLEKMVQSRAAEPVPSTSWTPPVAPPAPAPTPAQATFSAIPQTPTPTAPPTPPPAEPAVAAKPAEEASVGPFQFGKRDNKADDAPKPAEEAVTEPVLDFSAPPQQTPEPAAAETAEATTDSQPAPVVEEKAVAEPEPKRDARRSMRSMMFGEEPSSPSSAAPDAPESGTVEPAAAEATSAEPAAAETTPEDSKPDWPSYPWNRRDEASSSIESETTTSEPTPSEEAPVEATPETEPVGETAAGDAYDPWKPSIVAEPEPAESPESAEPEPASAEVTDETPVAEVPSEPVAASGEKSGAGTVVIIEDDQTAASYYATLFSGNGYHVEVANDGVSGVDLCARVQPQVILLDVMMPRQNGILVLQTLRASDETKNTPVVVMSNFSEPTLIKRAIQLGALEYVIKTQVEGPALLNALPRWMNREKAFAAA